VGIEQSPVPQGFLAQLAFPILAQTGRATPVSGSRSG
jgi:hypothetical protein